MNPKSNIPSVKHGGGSIIFWKLFSGSIMCCLFKIVGTIKKEHHDILKGNMKDSAKYDFGRWCFTFEYNNNLKHMHNGEKFTQRHLTLDYNEFRLESNKKLWW